MKVRKSIEQQRSLLLLFYRRRFLQEIFITVIKTKMINPQESCHYCMSNLYELECRGYPLFKFGRIESVRRDELFAVCTEIRDKIRGKQNRHN